MHLLIPTVQNNHFIIAFNTNLMFCLFPDIVPSLPEGWPQFRNRSWRRRSCELVKSTSSCVRKAVSHLHQLQDLIDSFYFTGPPDEEERFSKQRSSVVSGNLAFSLFHQTGCALLTHVVEWC